MTKTIVVHSCNHCPFVTGMGGGDEMPGFVSCTLDKSGHRLIDESPTFDYPTPSWCPLKKNAATIKVVLETRS